MQAVNLAGLDCPFEIAIRRFLVPFLGSLRSTFSSSKILSTMISATVILPILYVSITYLLVPIITYV
ncbi:hypothetical protein BDV12DRAFT_171779 [Aspergillus spectabilis]